VPCYIASLSVVVCVVLYAVMYIVFNFVELVVPCYIASLSVVVCVVLYAVMYIVFNFVEPTYE